jgi:hypothetical protein
MTQDLPGDSFTCDRCAASAMCALTYFVDSTPRAVLLCERCWQERRSLVGATRLEGAITWGEDWDEVSAWINRLLAQAGSRPMRHLIAFELARQLPHLPSPVPPAARSLLDEFGLNAS